MPNRWPTDKVIQQSLAVPSLTMQCQRLHFPNSICFYILFFILFSLFKYYKCFPYICFILLFINIP